MSEAEAQAVSSSLMGQAGLIQLRLAELKMKMATLGLASGGVMRLMITTIHVMIEMLEMW